MMIREDRNGSISDGAYRAERAGLHGAAVAAGPVAELASTVTAVGGDSGGGGGDSDSSCAGVSADSAAAEATSKPPGSYCCTLHGWSLSTKEMDEAAEQQRERLLSSSLSMGP